MKYGTEHYYKIITTIFIIVVFIICMTSAFLGIYKCPLDYLGGIPCPMCGLTRAYIYVLKGDFVKAFYFHPLWPIIPIAIVIFLLYSIGVLKLSKKAFDYSCFVLAILIAGCYVIRYVQGSPIVRIHIQDAFIIKILD